MSGIDLASKLESFCKKYFAKSPDQRIKWLGEVYKMHPSDFLIAVLEFKKIRMEKGLHGQIKFQMQGNNDEQKAVVINY